jgi:hypothetical protein
MPKRVLDFDALWASDKIAACAEWAQAEYAWIYGLADANGSFELTNLRVLWCKVAAVRKKLPFTRFEQVISEFHSKGLLFIWSHDRKTYGHWTGSDKPGRLPRVSRRTPRYGPIYAPPVPVDGLQKYQANFGKHWDAENVATRHDCVVGLGLGLGLGLDLGKGVGVGSGEGADAPEKGAQTARAKPQPSPSVFAGTHLVISKKQDHLLAEAFPWVDREAEYRKADAWLEASPERRPRKTARFVQNWFSRISTTTKDQGGKGRAERLDERNRATAGF